MYSQISMYLFGVATAYGSVLAFLWLERWHERHQRRAHVKRGKSYWDAILAEDRRRHANDEPVFFMHEQDGKLS